MATPQEASDNFQAEKATIQLGFDATGAKKGADDFKKAADEVKFASEGAAKGHDEHSKSLLTLEKVMHDAQHAILGLFTGIIALASIHHVVEEMLEFQQAMAKLQGITGATADQMHEAAEKAKELAYTTKSTGIEVLNAMTQMGRAGFTIEEGMNTATAATRLAFVGAMDLNEATSVLTLTLRRMRLDSSEASNVVDTLFVASKRSSLGIGELAEGLRMVGPLAASMKIPFSDIAAAMATLGHAGTPASQAGMQLRGMLNSLLDPTAQARKQIRDLGLSLDDINPQKKGILGAMEAFAEKNLTTAEALNIFDRRSVNAALNLTAYIDTLKDLTEETGHASGATDNYVKVVGDTLPGALIRLKAAVGGSIESVAEFAASWTFPTKAVDFVTDVIRQLGGVPPRMKESANATHLFAEALKAAAVAAALVTGIELAPYLLALLNPLKVVTAAQWLLNYAISANPIGLIAGAVGVAVFALMHFKDSLIDVTDTADESVQHTVTVGAVMKAVWEEAGVDVSHFWKNTKDITRDGWTAVIGDTEKARLQMLKLHTDGNKAIKSNWQTLWDDLKSIAKASANFIIGILKTIGDFILDVVKGFMNLTGSIAEIEFTTDLTKFKASLVRVKDGMSSAFATTGQEIKDDVKKNFTHDWIKDITDGFGKDANYSTLSVIKNRILGDLTNAELTWNGQKIDIDPWRKRGEAAGEAFAGGFQNAVNVTDLSNIDVSKGAPENPPVMRTYIGNDQSTMPLQQFSPFAGADDWWKRVRDRALSNQEQQQKLMDELTHNEHGPTSRPSHEPTGAGGNVDEFAAPSTDQQFKEQLLTIDRKIKLQTELIGKDEDEKQVLQQLFEIQEIAEKAGYDRSGAEIKQYEVKLRELQKLQAAEQFSLQLQDRERQFGREKDMLGLTSDEKEVRQQLNELEDVAHRAGIKMSDDRIEAYKRELEWLQQVKKFETIANDMGSEIAGAFTDFISGAKTAKEAVQDLAKSIEQMLLQQLVQQPLSQILGKAIYGLAGSIGSAVFGGAAAGVFPGGSSVGAGNPTIDYPTDPNIIGIPEQHARGDVFNTTNTSYHASGDVFNTPFTFMANGRQNIAAEAGPEAVMPLRRGPDGKLGVAAGGNSEHSTTPTKIVNQYQYITIQTPNADGMRRSERQIRQLLKAD